MDELLFETYIPYPDAQDMIESTGAPSAQAELSEPTRRVGKQEGDLSLDKLMLDLGIYDDFIDPAAPTRTEEAAPKAGDASPLPEAEPEPSEPEPADFEAAEPEETRPKRAWRRKNKPAKAAGPEEISENAPDHTILRADEKPEDEPELESAYLRRVARREAARAEREDALPLSEAERNAPPDETGAEDDDLYQLDSDIAEEMEDRERRRSKNPFVEKLTAPLVRYLATRKAREKILEEEAAIWPAPVDIRQTPELSAAKASRYYNSQVFPLGTRLYISLFLTLVLAWIALRLPLAGLLRQNTPMQAAVSFVFLLVNMLCALDILTTGMQQLFHLQPAMEALCVVSCLAACLDAFLTMLGVGSALPFCALPSASLTAALWGEKLFCLAQTDNFNTASAKGREYSYLCAEQDTDGMNVITRSYQARGGIVRRSEEADGAQRMYFATAPLLLIAAVVLAILSTIGQKWNLIFHNLSAYFAICANIGGFLCFALPYHTASLRLRNIGAALAGWAGCEEIGRSHRFIVKDSDLFLPDQIRIGHVEIPDNTNVEKVLSYTVSVLEESGSSISSVFAHLMERYNCPRLTVTSFKCEEGGFTATIHNESVVVGAQGFMHLKHIHVPHNINTENAVCIGIAGELAGVFNLEYYAARSKKDAMELFRRGRTQPMFAIRDFNITPLMIQQMFDIPVNNFVFPSFRERYRLSSQFDSKDTPPAVILRRRDLSQVVQAVAQIRRLYTACRTNALISIGSSLLAMLIVFLTMHGGNIAAVTAGGMLSYSVLAALPVAGLAIWALF